ncbi:polymyxin B resistance protein kinase [Coccidioides immitis H538.4]|uniref:mitogen-activated protein kinase kinase n=1 Tax=Coccidioides immitis H538.4 TaxID=396776 RepID=A0A0J8RCS2_COCIT|nr:polymyxin B resistance protein kinase [Coccidioides immitis H538.4]
MEYGNAFDHMEYTVYFEQALLRLYQPAYMEYCSSIFRTTPHTTRLPSRRHAVTTVTQSRHLVPSRKNRPSRQAPQFPRTFFRHEAHLVEEESSRRHQRKSTATQATTRAQSSPQLSANIGFRQGRHADSPNLPLPVPPTLSSRFFLLSIPLYPSQPGETFTVLEAVSLLGPTWGVLEPLCEIFAITEPFLSLRAGRLRVPEHPTESDNKKGGLKEVTLPGYVPTPFQSASVSCALHSSAQSEGRRLPRFLSERGFWGVSNHVEAEGNSSRRTISTEQAMEGRDRDSDLTDGQEDESPFSSPAESPLEHNETDAMFPSTTQPPSLRTVSPQTMTPSSTPLGQINAARRALPRFLQPANRALGGLAAKRGLKQTMKLSDAGGTRPAFRAPTSLPEGVTGPHSKAHFAQTQSGFNKYSEIIDTKAGTIRFKDKAVIHGGGIDFTGGHSFSISLDEVETLDELGKGNYGTVYKVRHCRPRLRRPGLGLRGSMAPHSVHQAENAPNSEDGETDQLSNVVMAMKEIRLELDKSKFTAIIMELDILHRCVSPFIIDFYGAFFQEGAVYICVEYMDGGSMEKLYGDGVPENI